MRTPSHLQSSSCSRGRAARLVGFLVAFLSVAVVFATAGSAQDVPAAPAVPIWVDQFGTPDYEWAGAVAVHESDVYVTSHDYGPAYVRKYAAADGALAWERSLLAETSNPVTLWADGARVCVGGTARQSLPGDPLEVFPYAVGYVRCLDPDGSVRWTRYIPGTVNPPGGMPETRVHALAGGPDYILVVGETTNTLLDCPAESCTSAGGVDLFVQKYRMLDGPGDGDLLWSRQAGTSYQEFPYGVAVDPSSGEADVWGVAYQTFQQGPTWFDARIWQRHLDVSGVVTRTAELGIGALYPTAMTSAGGALYMAAAITGAVGVWRYDLDETGSLRPGWSLSIPYAEVQAIQAGPSRLYVAGKALSPLPGQAGAGYHDAFVREYEIDGATPAEAWTIQFGSAGADAASSIAVDSNRIFVAGYTTGTLDPDGGYLGHTDAYVARFAVPFEAEAGGPYSVDEGSTVTLYASSTAVDYGQTLTYAWDLDGDGTFEAPGQTVTYTPADDTGSPFTVRVQVTDDDSGGTAEAEATVTVANVAPIVDAGPDLTLERGQVLDRTIVFTDPGADSWTVSASYGDGTASVPVTVLERTFRLLHSYAAVGTYTVNVTVDDGDGGVGTDSVVVTWTAVAATSGLIDQIEDLVDEGILNGGQGNSLLTKLEQALAAIEAGDDAKAIRMLEAFIHQVNAFKNASILEPTKADDLIAVAQAVIASIAG